MRSRRLFAPTALLALLLAGAAWAAPARIMSRGEADRFMKQVARKEARFHRDGVGFDRKTGLTYDGHDIDFATGKLAGGPRNWSAASKESLHVILLVKSITGDKTARAIVKPKLALELLQRKIDSYEQFDRAHPGYGGFLPWYKIEDQRMKPMPDWETRVPGLDNGQLAWSLYVAAGVLEERGHHELATRYQGHLDLMKRNVVKIFYDPTAKKLRAEAKIAGGLSLTPGKNRYENNVAGYFLDDAYEGLLLNHFADSFGDWKGNPGGKEALWATPRRQPASYRTAAGKQITVVQGHWFSSHEEWAALVLPFRDEPIARKLFDNGNRVRTQHAAEQGLPGMFASTHEPISAPGTPGYVSNLGIAGITKLPVRPGPAILAPYAAFPLALTSKPAFATWFRTMLRAPRMFGENGIGESFAAAGDGYAPVLTWDGKMLPMVAWMGGTQHEVQRFLQRDGLYDQFRLRVRNDYRAFDGMKLQGSSLPLRAPSQEVPRAMPDFVN